MKEKIEVQKEFCNYEQCVDIKELGFKKLSIAYYYTFDEDNLRDYGDGARDIRGKFKIDYLTDNDEYIINSHKTYFVAAPLKQQAFGFFREEYKIHSSVHQYDIGDYCFCIDDGVNKDIEIKGFNSYEEAEEACINKLIEIFKNKTRR